MPYEWVIRPAKAPDDPGAFSHAQGRPPAYRLQLWPYRSLPRCGFVAFIAATAGLIALPLLTVIGSPVLWGLLPFVMLAVGGLWWALERNYRDGRIIEDLALWHDHLSLVRHGPQGKRQNWQANPYWLRLTLHRSGGPVPQYLTLTDGGREVELGAFLLPDERLALAAEIRTALASLRFGRE